MKPTWAELVYTYEYYDGRTVGVYSDGSEHFLPDVDDEVQP